jgi:hypothetical protein
MQLTQTFSYLLYSIKATEIILVTVLDIVELRANISVLIIIRVGYISLIIGD